MKLTFQGLLIHLPVNVKKLENIYFLYCIRDDSKMEANKTRVGKEFSSFQGLQGADVKDWVGES